MSDTLIENHPDMLRIEIDSLKRQLKLTDEMAAINAKMIENLMALVKDHDVRLHRPWWRMSWF